MHRPVRTLVQLLSAASLTAVLGLLAGVAQAQTFCVYDPIGTQGSAYAAAKDYATAAKGWGVNLELRVYTDETVAVEDFKAGQCEMAVMTGLRARQFNSFTATLDAIGAIESYDQLRRALALMASPKTEKYMSSGRYEVAGIFALGAGYVFVDDRKIDRLSKAAGKKIAVLDFDKTQAMLVREIGAEAVMSDISNYASKFNDGAVDIVVAPAILYKPFELYKGMAKKGAVADMPVIQLTGQVVIQPDKFPPGFGQKSREYAFKQLDANMALIKHNESEIDPKFWMPIKDADREDYVHLMREARIHLADAGFYDRRMLELLKRVRCEDHPTAGECALGAE